MRVGLCFFTPQNVPGGRHLWIVVSDPTKSNYVAIVSFSTQRGQNSDGCMVAARSHQHLGQDSFVRCEFARVEQHAMLDEKLAAGYLRETFDADAALVAGVQKILLDCRLTARGIQNFIAKQLAAEEDGTTSR